jgi:hypothetical protein
LLALFLLYWGRALFREKGFAAAENIFGSGEAGWAASGQKSGYNQIREQLL